MAAMLARITAAWEAFAKQDYKNAGSQLQKAVFNLYQWTSGHLCTSDACYIFSGVLQYFEDLAKDIKKCGADLEDMVSEFHQAFDLMTHKKSNSNTTAGFTWNTTSIKAGIGKIGKGIEDLATAVTDCHLEELLEIVTALAAKLVNVFPEVTIIEEVLKILIEGVSVERDIAGALEDYAANNWAGFGYNIIKLVKILATSKHADQTEIVI